MGASPHPLRRLTDTFSDPRFNLAFGTNFAASWPRQVEQFYVNEGNALRLWDDYAAGRFDPHGDGEPNTSWNSVRLLHVASPSALSSIIRPSLNGCRLSSVLTFLCSPPLLSMIRLIQSRWQPNASASTRSSGEVTTFPISP